MRLTSLISPRQLPTMESLFCPKWCLLAVSLQWSMLLLVFCWSQWHSAMNCSKNVFSSEPLGMVIWVSSYSSNLSGERLRNKDQATKSKQQGPYCRVSFYQGKWGTIIWIHLELREIIYQDFRHDPERNKVCSETMKWELWDLIEALGPSQFLPKQACCSALSYLIASKDFCSLWRKRPGLILAHCF